MDKAIEEKIIIKDIEYLIELLHREWKQSKKEGKVIIISKHERINQKLVNQIKNRQNILQKSFTFRESIDMSKDNFILLRLLKKIKKSEDMSKENVDFNVKLDEEEFELFNKIILM